MDKKRPSRKTWSFLAPTATLELALVHTAERYIARRGDVRLPLCKITQNCKAYPERQINSQFAQQTMSVKLMSLKRSSLKKLCDKKKQSLKELLSYGSHCWARTSDIMINSHALYRLS